MSKTKRFIASFFMCMGLAPLMAGPSSAATKIGNASSVNNLVEGTLEGATRKLTAGNDVHASELVRTGDGANTRMIFLDQTNLSVGPKSQVKLDQFVYDPNRRAGKVVVEAGRGLFRFVTGRQRSDSYTVNTPIASIGVRGTTFDLLVRSDRITVLLGSGETIIRTRRGRVIRLTQPGTSVTIYASGRVDGPARFSGPIFDTASNAPFPYFGGSSTAARRPPPSRGADRPADTRPPSEPRGPRLTRQTPPDTYPDRPRRPTSYPDRPRGPDYYPRRPHRPTYYPGRPQRPSYYPGRPQRPSYYPGHRPGYGPGRPYRPSWGRPGRPMYGHGGFSRGGFARGGYGRGGYGRGASGADLAGGGDC